MKKTVLFAAICAIFIVSCSGSQEKKDDASKAPTENVATESTDWDDILDSYEKYVDELLALSKKISDGNLEVMDDYNKAMQKAQDLSTKLNKAKDDISTEQLNRLNGITLKMGKGLQNL